MLSPIDPKALTILFGTRWSAKGWHDEAALSEEDRVLAKAERLIFDPMPLGHDALIADIGTLRDRISLQQVAAAFVASLSTRRLDLRSALGSWMAARHMPLHTMAQSPSELWPTGNRCCQICNGIDYAGDTATDLNILSLERHKWGGLRHTIDPAYVWFDLREFALLPQIDPSVDDRRILGAILSVARSVQAAARPGDLEKALGKVVKSNAYERRVLISILAIAGVLQPQDQPSLRTGSVAAHQRIMPVMHKTDWPWPAVWWRGSDGVDAAAVAEVFGGFL